MNSFSWDDLSEEDVRRNAAPEVFSRGGDYYRRGAVTSLVRRGDVLQAEVEGSGYEPYRVAVTVGPDGIEDATCTCPYDWGGWCKHIVAVLLACLNEPGDVEEQPALEDLLSGLSRDQLQALLVKLAARDPSLSDDIAAHVALLGATSAATSAIGAAIAPEAAAIASPNTPSPSTPVDPQPFRRQVRAILHGADRMRRSESYRHTQGIVDEVRQVLDEARVFLEAGNGRNALIVLEAITDEYLKNWDELDDSDGDAGDFFNDLGEVWAEAILTADLSSKERQSWGKKLAKWQREIGDYVDGGFEAAVAAVEQHWDYPPLVRVLQGKARGRGIWGDDDGDDDLPWYADDLTVARLNVLERQGRYQEAARLAEAEGQIARYVAMLARMGQVPEAMQYALRHLETAGEALAFAQTLHERGAIEEALRIAEHGLTLQRYNKAELAVWLRDMAAQHGKPEQALQAALAAVREAPNLKSYLRAWELAGENWSPLREELLQHLRQRGRSDEAGPVDIFLHERLFDDALNIAQGSWDRSLIGRVVDAVTEHLPNEVIPICHKQADDIMDKGEASHYDTAVHWLQRAKKAYRVAGREAEWKALLEKLIDRHQKKWKLRPMLQSLRGA
jgi:uncharacterized Zn finger protein